MYVVMCPNDTWLQTTIYYREFLRLYYAIVNEYVTDRPTALSPLRCPVLDSLLDNANVHLTLDNEKFRTCMNEQITHLYGSFPTKFRMMGMYDVAESFAALAPHVEGLILFVPGTPELIQPSLEYHGLHEFVTICYTEDITPETLNALLVQYGLSKDNVLFVGSSPARELNAAVSAGIQCSRVYYPNYVLYNETTFEDIPTFPSFLAFAQAFVELHV